MTLHQNPSPSDTDYLLIGKENIFITLVHRISFNSKQNIFLPYP